jgi:hypothetical protein
VVALLHWHSETCLADGVRDVLAWTRQRRAVLGA